MSNPAQATRQVHLSDGRTILVHGHKPCIYWNDPAVTSGPGVGVYLLASPSFQTVIEHAEAVGDSGDFDTSQPLASRRGFPVDPLAKLPPKTRKRPQGSIKPSRRTSAVAWVKRLPEVGDPMLMLAKRVDQLYADAAQLLKTAKFQEAALAEEVNGLWKPREITAAKRASLKPSIP